MSPELRGHALAYFIAQRQALNGFLALGNEIERAAMYDRFIAELTAPAAMPATSDGEQILQDLHNTLYLAQRADRVSVLIESIGKARLLLARYRNTIQQTMQPQAKPSDAMGVFAIEVEKLLCKKLGIDWVPAGMSIESLVDRLAAPAAGEQAGAVAYQGPKKFTAEEVADGNLGIRWVTAEAVMGRPSSHDVMEYLKRNTGAMCNCEQCRAFFPALAAPGAAIAAREQEAIDRAAWAKLAAKAHGWADDSTPPMVEGRFEAGWHESEFQTFMQGVRHGRS